MTAAVRLSVRWGSLQVWSLPGWLPGARAVAGFDKMIKVSSFAANNLAIQHTLQCIALYQTLKALHLWKWLMMVFKNIANCPRAWYHICFWSWHHNYCSWINCSRWQSSPTERNCSSQPFSWVGLSFLVRSLFVPPLLHFLLLPPRPSYPSSVDALSPP